MTGTHTLASESSSLPSRVNVDDTERWLSALGGGVLAAYGLSRESTGGLLATLAGAFLLHRGLTGHCPMFEALGVRTGNGSHAPATSVPTGHGMKVERAITINRPAHDLFRAWRDLQQLPRFMSHLESVQPLGGGLSRWVAKGPLGARVAWDAQIITERENEVIAWRSLEDSDIDTAGSVHFLPAPDGRGTEVHVTLKYDPPGGKLGIAVARLFGEDPDRQIQDDLLRFKEMMESGELAMA